MVAVWWSLWGYALPAALNAGLSLVCYLIGWTLSDCSSYMPLARAGAAATIIAIGFTLYDYRAALMAGQEKAANLFAKLTSGFPLTGEQSRRTVQRKLTEKTGLAARAIEWSYAIVLMIATFVWGFGDLAVKLVDCP